MGKRAELENSAIRLYAEGSEIPAIAIEIGVSENSLRDWKKRAGTEWDEARAVCRKGYVASMETVGSRMARAREISDQLTGDTKTQGKLGLVLNTGLQTMLYDLMDQMQTVDLGDFKTRSATIDQMNSLAQILQRTENAANLNLKRELEIRKDERDKALQAAADVMEKTGKKRGLSTATVQQIRSEILGIAQ